MGGFVEEYLTGFGGGAVYGWFFGEGGDFVEVGGCSVSPVIGPEDKTVGSEWFGCEDVVHWHDWYVVAVDDQDLFE